MIYLSVKEVAELENKTSRAIQTSIKNNKIVDVLEETGKGRCGRIYKIPLSSLSQETQDKYYNNGSKEKEYKDILQYTANQREDAEKKAHAVILYQRSEMKVDDFIEQFNKDYPNFQITKSTLFRWQNNYNKNGDVADLIDTRGGHNSGKDSIDEKAWEYFYSLFMTEQKRSAQLCYDLTKLKYKGLPSIATFNRKIKAIPEYVIQYYRYGKKVFNDNLPYMERDYTDINSNDIWFSDHHLMDVFVRDSKNNPVRPWLTSWLDARSRKIMGYKIRIEEPNTDVVKSTLRDGIQTNGVASELYVDNGKDYKAKDGLNMDYPYSLVNRLGINTIYATKYHGQAKSIERWHRTIEERFGKRFETYAGNDAKERPESLKDVPIENYPTIDEFRNAFTGWLDEYHNAEHRGNGMNNKTPNQVYYENLKVKRQIQDTEALRLLCGRVAERKITKNGINLFDNAYWNDKFIYLKGKEIIVIYDPENIEEINIFDKDMKAICKAIPKVTTPFRSTTSEDYREAKKKQKIAKKLVKEYQPIKNMEIWQQIAQNQALEKEYKEQAETQCIDMITPQMQQNINILKEDNTKNNKNKEKSVAASILDMYEAQ